MMRIANQIHLDGPWLIGQIAPDFRLEDAWDLPATGDLGDFQRLIDFVTAMDPTGGRWHPGRILWDARKVLGRWLDAGELDRGDVAVPWPIPGTDEVSLAWRMPADLSATAEGITFDALPFTPLYRTEDEFAAEIGNKTMHGVLHLAWVAQPDGTYRGRLGVYVKPRGRLGEYYMAFIRPFRHWLVYPGLMRSIARAWRRGPARA